MKDVAVHRRAQNTNGHAHSDFQTHVGSQSWLMGKQSGRESLEDRLAESTKLIPPLLSRDLAALLLGIIHMSWKLGSTQKTAHRTLFIIVPTKGENVHKIPSVISLNENGPLGS